MPGPALATLAAGLLAVAAGLLLVRASGAPVGKARRLAGAREVAVGELRDLADPPRRPVRVVGRVRCPNPIVTPRDDRLVAYHRDVEVELPRIGWQAIERIRETRGFELWDHAGSLPIDPVGAAEPLITIPHVWSGDPSELDETYRPAIERLAALHGAPRRARSTTRMLSVVDRLLILAEVAHGPNGVALRPPPDGYLISSLALDEAMRLLGGERRRWLLVGSLLVAAGALTVFATLGVVAGAGLVHR